MELNWVTHHRSRSGTSVGAEVDEDLAAPTPGRGGPGPAPSWPPVPHTVNGGSASGPSGPDLGLPPPPPAPARADEPEADEHGPADELASLSPGRTPGRMPGWLRRDTFRSRVSLLVALAVGFSVTMAAVATYVAVRHELYAQSNNNLATAVDLAPPPQVFFGELHPQDYQGFEARTGDEVQVIGLSPSNNEVVYSIDPSTGLMVQKKFFGITSQAQAVFRDGSSNSEVVQTLTGSNGHQYRVATVNEGDLTVQIGYPMANTDRTLSFLRLMLLLVVLAGMALAMALGWGVGRATMKPVEDLTIAAEHVAETQDLSATIDDSGNDELARLARSFNAMLAALSASRLRQAHLVSDAGHELRTPLTSLRTNIEVLMRNRNLAGEDRDALLSDVNAQVQELSTLVGDLVDLAREDERPDAEPEVVAFDDLVRKAVERAHRRAMSLQFDLNLEPGPVKAHAALLERAVMNVLDNAAKWSPAGGTVKVDLAAADDNWHLRVSDQGPGIAAEDLPHIFERFYRAASARSLPGSGLGLAIVQRVVSTHNGSVNVSGGASGGTVVEIVLPVYQAPANSAPSAAPPASVSALAS